MMKQRRKGWADHVAHTGGRRNAYKVSFGFPQAKGATGNTQAHTEGKY